MQFVRLELQGADDLGPAFDTAGREQVEAIFIQTDSLVLTNRARIAELAAASGIPTISDRREYAEVGGLLAHGPNLTTIYRRSAYYVYRILKGAKPADLPVEQPREFEFVINLKTAQTLGLAIPQHVLLQATDVMQ